MLTLVIAGLVLGVMQAATPAASAHGFGGGGGHGGGGGFHGGGGGFHGGGGGFQGGGGHFGGGRFGGHWHGGGYGWRGGNGWYGGRGYWGADMVAVGTAIRIGMEAGHIGPTGHTDGDTQGVIATITIAIAINEW